MRVIPPLSQSRHEQMACPESYIHQTVEGHKQPDSMASERGSEVHHVLSEYIRHCVARKVAVDFPHFDKLAAAAGPVAGPILDNLRDTFVVDWKHVLATELRLRLDSELRPTLYEQKLDGILHLHVEDELPALDEDYSREPAAHAGTLDVLKISDDATEATVDDFKSHPRPFDPDTYQAVLYSFMVFKHIPTLRKVTFRLIFVRYGADVIREASWTRDEMPEMANQIRRARERQLALEAAGTGPALPGSHCLGGDTRFLTEHGVRTLREACGESVRVLNRHGEWEDAEVRSFGIQQLMRVTFDDGSVVRATAGHRWWKLNQHPQNEGWIQTDQRITTMELDRVPIVRHAVAPAINAEGIRHGFVYGDGYKRAHRSSCVVNIVQVKDHMLRYFPDARMQTDGRYRKGGLPAHFKTLDNIDSPDYARGFTAGVVAADGSVCQNGGVHLFCEGRDKAYQLAEVARLGGCVVSSVKLSSSEPTNYSRPGTTYRELMRIDIKPSTAPVIDPRRVSRLKKNNQMRRMYREVVSIEADGFEEVFCAVVPGSESFTLANGIATSNCQYCPKLSRPTLCSISEFNPQLTTKPEERLRFNVWAAEMAKLNRGVLKDMVDASGRSIFITDANGRKYEFGCHATESQVFPLDETFLELARNHMTVSPDTWETMKLRVSSSKLKSLLKAKKREGFRIALEASVVEMETRPKFGIRRPDGDIDTGYSQEEDF